MLMTSSQHTNLDCAQRDTSPHASLDSNEIDNNETWTRNTATNTPSQIQGNNYAQSTSINNTTTVSTSEMITSCAISDSIGLQSTTEYPISQSYIATTNRVSASSSANNLELPTQRRGTKNVVDAPLIVSTEQSQRMTQTLISPINVTSSAQLKESQLINSSTGLIPTSNNDAIQQSNALTVISQPHALSVRTSEQQSNQTPSVTAENTHDAGMTQVQS